MKSIQLKLLVYWKILRYFFDGLLQFLGEPVGRIFGPDDNSYPEVGVQPYQGEYYSRWE